METETAEAEGWLNLWQFARTLSPKACYLAAWWTCEPPTPASVRVRAESVLKASDPSVRNAIIDIRSKLRPGYNEARAIDALWVYPLFLKLLNQEMERQMNRRCHLGRFLLASVIPDRLRQRLSRGGYEVTARMSDDRIVSLDRRDLIGLEIDLANNALSGDGTVYRAVRVRRVLHDVSQPVAEEATADADPYHSGGQGRPSSMNLIAIELERRRQAGETLATLAAEGAALADWLARNHPKAARALPKTIQNSLRPELNASVIEAKARKQGPK